MSRTISRLIVVVSALISSCPFPAACQTVEELQAEIAKLKETIATQKNPGTTSTANAQSAGDFRGIESFPLRAKRFSAEEAKAILVARDALERQLGRPLEAFYGVAHLEHGYRILIQAFRGRDSKGTPRFIGGWDIVISTDWDVIHIHDLRPGLKLLDPTATPTPGR